MHTHEVTIYIPFAHFGYQFPCPDFPFLATVAALVLAFIVGYVSLIYSRRRA
jgi:hypothetical protein